MIRCLQREFMHLNKTEIASLKKVPRLNIINSITGIKPGNVVGTKSKNGISNLAIISSVVHLSSNPALIGFIMRPSREYRRDTYNNILESACYTINHVHTSFIERAHYTSAKFDKDISEFDACGLTEEYIEDFFAPFVKESTIKMALTLREQIPIQSSNTTLIVGEIEHIFIPDEIIDSNGYLDLGKGNSVGISGLNSYYELSYKASFPYARVHQLPNDLKKNS